MVVEELVASLGFKASPTSLAEIRKLDRVLVSVKKSIADFETSIGRGLNSVKFDNLRDLSVTHLPKLASGLKAGVSSAAMFAGGLTRVALTAGSVATGIGHAVMAVVDLGKAVIDTSGKAAVARRNLQLDAKQKRTTAADVDIISRGLEAIGMDKEAGAKAVGDVSASMNEAIKKSTSDEAQWFRKNKIATMDRRGNELNPASVFLEIVRSYLIAQEQKYKLRADSNADQGNKKKERAANLAEFDFRRNQDKFPGIDEEMQKFLGGVKNFAEFMEKQRQAVSNRPAATKEEEDRRSSIAKKYDAFSQKLDAISEGILRPIENFRDVIVLRILEPLNDFSDGILALMKKWGLISQTQAEKDAQTKTRAKINNESPELQKAIAEAAKLPPEHGLVTMMKSFMGDETQQAFAALRKAAIVYDSQKEAALSSGEETQGLKDAATNLLDAANVVRNLYQGGAAAIVNQRPGIAGSFNDSRTMPAVNVYQTILGATAPSAAGAAVASVLRNSPSAVDINKALLTATSRGTGP